MKSNLYIFGAGGLGRDLAAFYRTDPEFSKAYELCGFLDEYKEPGERINGIQVFGGVEYLKECSLSSVILAIGNIKNRKKILNQLEGCDINYPTWIHANANLYCPSSIQLGKGVVICPGAHLTTNIQIGHFCLVHLGASIHHDVILGDHVLIMPGSSLYSSQKIYVAGRYAENKTGDLRKI